MIGSLRPGLHGDLPQRSLTLPRTRRINNAFAARTHMPKPRFHIRHLCRTFYLSEWWDE
jgi:hypothetical protein